MDATTEQLLRDGMRREGWRDGRAALVDQPSDRGGLTRGGVTARAWGSYRTLGRPATGEELLAMTEDEALAFYYAQHVVALGYDAVQDSELRGLLVDWSFTSWTAPTRALQRELKARGLYAGAIDGTFGPGTRTAVQADREPRRTFRAVMAARLTFYVDVAFDADVAQFLVLHPRTQLRNLRGWLNRFAEFL